MPEYDFIAIGDTVTDAFIRLKEAEVHCRINHTACEICMRFGDKIPYESVTVVPGVGNSANAAVSAARLGLRTAFVSNVGNDPSGAEIIKAIAREKVDTRFIKIHTGKRTNYHYVLWFQDDRTILIKHEDFEYELPDIGTPGWIYLSSLGEHSLPFHTVLANYFRSHPATKLAFQPGTYQMKFGTAALQEIYRRADAFFCNREEAGRILRTTETDMKKLLAMVHELGPKVIAITDGKKGAYASDGMQAWFMPPYPDPQPPISRTGAGDAFASTFTVALALGKSVPEALRMAPINSMSVVQHVGARAGLLAMAELEEYLARAQADYQPQPLS